MSPIVRRAAVATILAIAATAARPAGRGRSRRCGRPTTASSFTAVPPGYRPLTIKTLPPIPGVRVQLNGTELVTGPDGTVRTLITKADRDALAADRDAHLRMISKNVDISPGLRGRFHGWYQAGYVFTPQNPVGEVRIATFDLDARTRFTFVDRHQAALDAARHHRHADQEQPRRTDETSGGRRPSGCVRRSSPRSTGKVTLKDVDWRLASVTFHDTNIVQRGLQHFKPRETPRSRSK